MDEPVAVVDLTIDPAAWRLANLHIVELLTKNEHVHVYDLDGLWCLNDVSCPASIAAVCWSYLLEEDL